MSEPGDEHPQDPHDIQAPVRSVSPVIVITMDRVTSLAALLKARYPWLSIGPVSLNCIGTTDRPDEAKAFTIDVDDETCSIFRFREDTTIAELDAWAKQAWEVVSMSPLKARKVSSPPESAG